MKNAILFTLFFASSVFAKTPDEKIYLNLDQLQISEEGMFVLLGDNWLSINKLESDALGMFVRSEQFVPWYCERCGRWTTGWWVCEHCGNTK